MNDRSACDVELAQQTLRRENQIERVGSEYDMTMGQVLEEPEPAWEDGERPDGE